jgi:plastocyanin
MKRTSLAVVAALALALVAVGPAVADHSPSATKAATKKKRKPATKKISVGDNFFGPSKITIHAGDKLKFQWPEFSDTHDVSLGKGKGPKGAKNFTSPQYGGADAVWTTNPKKGQLSTPGKYHLVCTFHDTEMFIDVKVVK